MPPKFCNIIIVYIIDFRLSQWFTVVIDFPLWPLHGTGLGSAADVPPEVTSKCQQCCPYPHGAQTQL
jgi:hypothetical protein